MRMNWRFTSQIEVGVLIQPRLVLRVLRAKYVATSFLAYHTSTPQKSPESPFRQQHAVSHHTPPTKHPQTRPHPPPTVMSPLHQPKHRPTSCRRTTIRLPV